MKLSDIATYVTSKIKSNLIELSDYITTDCLLPNRQGKTLATNRPPIPCNLIHFQPGDILISNIRPYLKKIWISDTKGGASSDVLVFRSKQGIPSSFLFAALSEERFFNHMMNGSKGSKMPRGDKRQIMRYPIKSFSPIEQRRIGSLILNINDKLTLNRQINHNLSSLAHSSEVATVRHAA